MRLAISALASIALASSISAAWALIDDPITTRRALMQANGAVFYGLAQGMIKGEIPFDPTIAASVIRTNRAVAYSFGDYFPEGSDQGDTRASPRIWEDMEGFQAALEEFRQASDAAREADPETLEAFQASMDAIGQECQQCHEEFRLADN